MLVTGGAGFIGSHLGEKLKGCIVYDNLDPYYSLKLKEFNKALILRNGNQFIQKDIEEIDLKDMDCEYIIHYAAQPGVRYSVEHPTEVMKTNLIKTVTLLEKVRKSNVELKRFVYISSASVFGTPEYLPIDELHPKNPISPYGVSKLAAEHYVRSQQQQYGLRTVIIRPFTVVGGRQRPDMALHKFIEAIINNQPIHLYGDGTQTRDWTHVDNIVNGIILALKENAAIGEDFNFGSNIKTSVNEIIEKIASYLNKDYKIINKPKNSADPQEMHANIDKAKKKLGYKLIKTVDDAIIKHIDFYSKNSDLYRGVK